VALILYGQFQSLIQSLPRITEDGNNRVTESGDQRVTSDSIVNAAYGSLVASSLVRPFSSIYYVKFNGIWEEAEVFVKYNGNWVSPISAYKKENNIWKRVI
jgi:hypothetical protein